MRNEPNALLAIATGFSLALLVTTAIVFGDDSTPLKYLFIAVVVPLVLVPLNRMIRKRSGLPDLPMIHPEITNSVVWTAAFPAITFLIAMLPIFMPQRDHGLAVIVGAVLFGLTLDSALKARASDQ